MLDTLGRLEVTLANGDVDSAHHVLRTEKALVTLVPTGEAGQVRVALSGERTPGAPASVTVRFVKETPTLHPLGVGDPPSGVAARTSYRATALPADRYEVEIPAHHEYLRKLSAYSKPFAELAESINLAIAVATLCDEHAKGKDKALATIDLTKGLVGILEGLPAALAALKPELDAPAMLKGASGYASKPYAWLTRIDHAQKVYKGLVVLFSDESAVQHELRSGRPFRAELQRYSDIANVVVGTASALELAGTAVTAAGATEILGCSTLLLAGFSATPWGLVISVGGALIAAGSALVFDLTQPWDERLMELEQALAKACKEEVRERRLLVSTRLDGLREAVRNGW